MPPSFFSKQHKIPGRFVLLVLACVLAISSCASFRHYDLLGSATSLATTKSFYVVVNGATEKVDYDYLGAALIPGYTLDYEKYAKGRVRGDVKLDVPLEIVKYLKEQGRSAAMGPATLAPREDAVIISYDELWGWDMRPIIKALTIHAHPAGQPTEEASVKFQEMTIFNTQPVASSVVPAMMDVLFGSAAKPGAS
ncbi:MAG: hypothetical protein BVN28_01770 [Nitrospira sp. ST-bin4]|nr:MAG: hypothetical protein BVN28_01770 [Nitrospira sp. ST-bin4]